MLKNIALTIMCALFIGFGAICSYAVEGTEIYTKDDNSSYLHLSRFADTNRPVYKGNEFGIYGFAEIKFENVKNDDKSHMLLKSYLDFNMLNIGVDGLSFHFYGQMQNSIRDAEEGLDLYYGYLRYKTFQNALDIMAGRFEQISNSFMTLDGLQVSVITPAYFGVTLYGGIPYYKNFEDKKQVFRNTGDLLYGGRVFLSGIEDVNAYIGYSKETGKGDNGRYGTFNEVLSAGAYYLLGITDSEASVPGFLGNTKDYLSLAAFIDYDVHNNAMKRLSGRADYRFRRVLFSVFGDMFDVRDDYPEDRELVIQLLSNGKENRVGGNISFYITDWLSIYGGAFAANTEDKVGRVMYGAIYKAGFELTFVKSIGLLVAGEYYAYDSNGFDAMGGSLSGDWRFSHDFALLLSAEYAGMNYPSEKATAYSFEGEFQIFLLPNSMLSVFYEKGSNNRFIDDMRCGVMVRYDF